MDRRERAGELRGEHLIPAERGELADFALGAHAGEDAFGGLGGGFGLAGAARQEQHLGQVARRLTLQQQPLVQLGAANDFAQRLFGAGQLVLDDERERQDPEILGLGHGVRELAADDADAIEVAAGELGLAARDTDFRAAAQRQGV